MDEEIIKKLYEENGKDLIIAGAWILIIGNVISAVGQTKVVVTDERLNGKESVVIGNGVEAFGNVIQAVGREKLNQLDPTWAGKIAEVGCWLQAIGNIANSVGVQQVIEGELIEEEEEEDELERSTDVEEIIRNGDQINGLGSSVQATGAALEAYGIANLRPEISTPYEVTGNSMIALGAALDAIGTVYILQDQEEVGEIIELAGAYIQVVGAATELYGLSIGRIYEEGEKYSYSYYNHSK